ncbi:MULTISPECIES: hypothetical protein [Streptosporangium]|uniref:Uncharacterized protein n=1 Tax=Streptosporangium brasiliense TaxID=47480 RepID=A0ABT9RLQ2_9ACTN|nr:hypothetical protein [Streptosporangium brasiliense]MDP9870165.1 hypothetical protein [Streptosporangium brasiliense]
MSDYTGSRIFRLAFSAIVITAGVAATGTVAIAGTAAAGASGVTMVSASDTQPTPTPTPTLPPHTDGDPWDGS